MTAHTTAAGPGPGLDTAEPLADLAGFWVIFLTAERKAPGTVRLYEGSVRAFMTWHACEAPGMPVTAACLDRKTAAAFLADLLAAGAAPATARARYAALRQFSAWMAAEGAADADPLLGLRPPRQDRPRVDGLAAGELAALIKACRAPACADRWAVFECLRDEAAVRLLADTGMRAGELLAPRHRRRGPAPPPRDRHPGQGRQAPGGRVLPAEAARALDRYIRRGPPRPQARAHPGAVAGHREPPLVVLRAARLARPAGPRRPASPGSTRTASATPPRGARWPPGSRRGRDGPVRVVKPPDAGPVHRGHRPAAGRRVIRPVVRPAGPVTAARLPRVASPRRQTRVPDSFMADHDGGPGWSGACGVRLPSVGAGQGAAR